MSLSILKGSISDHQKVEQELETKSEAIQNLIYHIGKLEKEEWDIVQQQKKLTDTLKELDDYISDVPLSEMEEQLTQCKSDLALAKMTHSKLTQDLSSNMTGIQKVEKSLSDLNEGKTTHCSLCNQPLPEDQIETSRKNLEEKLEALHKEQSEIKINLQAEMDLESSLSYSIEELTGKIYNEKQRLNKQSNLESSLKSLALDKKKVEGSLALKRDEKDLLFITKEQLEGKVKEFNQGKSKLDSQIQEQENQLDLIQQELDSVEELEKQARDYIKETINPVEEDLSMSHNFLEEVLQELSNCKAELKVLKDNAPGEFPDNWDSLQEKLNKAKTKVIEIEGVISSLNQRLNSLTIIRSKVLNPKGLKPFVIGKKLTQINHYCSQYSSIVNNQLQVSVDEKGNYNFIVSFDGIERDGGSLSTGWTFHANMTLLGALTKEREKKTKVNCLFIDEPFATIPESSVQKVTDMIEAVGEGKSIHIITHSQMLDVTMAREVRIEGGLVHGIEIPSRIEI